MVVLYKESDLYCVLHKERYLLGHTAHRKQGWEFALWFFVRIARFLRVIHSFVFGMKRGKTV